MLPDGGSVLEGVVVTVLVSNIMVACLLAWSMANVIRRQEGIQNVGKKH